MRNGFNEDVCRLRAAAAWLGLVAAFAIVPTAERLASGMAEAGESANLPTNGQFAGERGEAYLVPEDVAANRVSWEIDVPHAGRYYATARRPAAPTISRFEP